MGCSGTGWVTVVLDGLQWYWMGCWMGCACDGLQWYWMGYSGTGWVAVVLDGLLDGLCM